MFDIAVVGAGPIGLYTAKLCKDMGYKVVIFEEHDSIGIPLACSGLISSNLEKFFPDIKKWGVVEHVVDSAILHSKRSKLTLKKSKAAYVLDRVKFDRKLSERVKSEIKFGTKVTGIKVKDNHVEINTNKGMEKSEIVIGCDGPLSVVARDVTNNKQMIKGLIAMTKEKCNDGNVDLYFDKSKLNDGFFWKIPRGNVTEYGALGKDVLFSDIEIFFKIKNYEKFGGLIPVSPASKTYSDRIILIGDSAGQVKPWSGGGVIYGLTCAQIAVKVIEKAFRFNDFSEDVLKEYEMLWKRKIGKQIIAGRLFRKFLRLSSDFQLDVAIKTGSIFNYKKLDMDFIFSGL
ncbi:MAG: NAD(P)/FAD-dependent oxidoreductase [Candidatus Aenigmarchaeota archaeon]|nr:NAD(P)/FAD-dependent oxidoreductase [Candidatus Aenigmarchaeota archaeon]